MSEPINLSEWNLDRIEAEQKKHRFGLIAHGIPQVDLSKKSIEDLDSITTAIEAIAKKATEEQELFIICELAKLYIESQRPAKWIPVTERLPEDDEDVLVTYTDSSGHSFIEMVWFDEGKFLSQDGKFEVSNVVAWMPLPSPYKEGEEKHGT